MTTMNKPPTFHLNFFPLRGSFFVSVVSVEGNYHTAAIADLTPPATGEVELAAGTGSTEAEALGYALLDLLDKQKNESPEPTP